MADTRRAIALEKGEDDIWDVKLAAGDLVDIDFIAQCVRSCILRTVSVPILVFVAMMSVGESLGSDLHGNYGGSAR